MSSSNYQKSTVQSLNAHLVTALLSLFITGVLLILIGLFFGIEQIDVSSESEMYQNLTIVVIIFGLILITLGVLQSLGIIKKIKKIIDQVLSKGDFGQRMEQAIPQASASVGGGLRIIRPTISTSEAEPIKAISPSPKSVAITQQVVTKQVEPIVKKSESQKGEALDITLEDGLQKILDRYNDPKVIKSFANWQNTLMMSFPNLNKTYLFKINGDQGIQLEEGFDEEAAVQVNLDADIFLKMMTKQINPIKAYSSGGLEVKGKMRNLLKLRKLMF